MSPPEMSFCICFRYVVSQGINYTNRLSLAVPTTRTACEQQGFGLLADSVTESEWDGLALPGPNKQARREHQAAVRVYRLSEDCPILY